MFEVGQEGRGDNRSEMPLDALGSTRNTIGREERKRRKRIRWIVVSKGSMKEEFLVSKYQQWVLN